MEGAELLELTMAIDAYNADLQAGQLLQAAADQQLVRFNELRALCTESSMPTACQDEFAEYPAIIDNAARTGAANTANSQGIAAEHDALLQGSGVAAFNDAVDASNAATALHNDIVNEWNVTLKPAFNAAVEACNQAA